MSGEHLQDHWSSGWFIADTDADTDDEISIASTLSVHNTTSDIEIERCKLLENRNIFYCVEL